MPGRISGKRAGYSGGRTNAQAVAVDVQPGVEEGPGEKGLSSLWGIQMPRRLLKGFEAGKLEYAVKALSGWHWGPGQVAGRWRKGHPDSVLGCPTPYRHIKRGLLPGVSAKEHLRRRGGRRVKRRAGYNTVHPERIIPEWPFAVGWAQGNGTAYHYTQGDDLGWPTGDSATLPSPTAATAGSPTFNDGPQGCFASVTGPSYETLCGDFSVCTEKGIGCWQQIYSAYRGYGAPARGI